MSPFQNHAESHKPCLKHPEVHKLFIKHPESQNPLCKPPEVPTSSGSKATTSLQAVRAATTQAVRPIPEPNTSRVLGFGVEAAVFAFRVEGLWVGVWVSSLEKALGHSCGYGV